MMFHNGFIFNSQRYDGAPLAKVTCELKVLRPSGYFLKSFDHTRVFNIN